MASAVRVAIANVQGGRGTRVDSTLDAENNLRLAGSEVAADIVCFAEIDNDHPRSGHLNHLEVLRAGGSFSDARFAATLIGDPGPGRRWQTVTAESVSGEAPAHAYGIGIVSRIPVVRWRRLNLVGSRLSLPMAFVLDGKTRVFPIPDEPRVALAATVDAGFGPVTMIGTHLSFIPSTSLRQLRRIVQWAEGFDEPFVIAGDLNLPPRLVRTMFKQPLGDFLPTYPAYKPKSQLDYILASSGLAVSGLSTQHLSAGDHLSVAAEISRS
jgi:hypothetical protein